jgi:hypothetical protein
VLRYEVVTPGRRRASCRMLSSAGSNNTVVDDSVRTAAVIPSVASGTWTDDSDWGLVDSKSEVRASMCIQNSAVMFTRGPQRLIMCVCVLFHGQ